jgi:pimeloyl-ACP methyl ester carboxylesterase
MREHSPPPRSGIKSALRHWATPRLIHRTGLLVGFIFVPLALMPGCGGDEGPEAGKTTTTDAMTTTETSDDVPQTVIDGRFPVGADNRKLAILCLGEGSPTILLESGDGDAISQFAGLLDPLAKRTLTCAYDRLGTGQSDPPTERRRTVDDVVADLHRLLDVAKVPGPYLLVGQSLGGNVAHHYAGRYPERVAGVVLLDVGLPTGDLGKEFPGPLGWRNPEHVDWVDMDRRAARRLLPLGDIPLVVVTATEGYESVKQQSAWLRLSSRSRQTTLEGGHDLHEENPDGVIKEIESTLEAIRG